MYLALIPLIVTQTQSFKGLLFISFNLQTYVNLEVYDDSEYVNFDMMTEREWWRMASDNYLCNLTEKRVALFLFFAHRSKIKWNTFGST